MFFESGTLGRLFVNTTPCRIAVHSGKIDAWSVTTTVLHFEKGRTGEDIRRFVGLC